MFRIILKKCFILLIPILLLMPPTVEAQKKSGVNKLPLPVRRILFQAASLLKKKSYKKALQTVLDYQNRDKSNTRSKQAESQNYHHPEIYFILEIGYFHHYQYIVSADALEFS